MKHGSVDQGSLKVVKYGIFWLFSHDQAKYVFNSEIGKTPSQA